MVMCATNRKVHKHGKASNNYVGTNFKTTRSIEYKYLHDNKVHNQDESFRISSGNGKIYVSV